MIKPKGIDHIVLKTANLDAMLSFYTHILGCVVERQIDTPIHLVQLRCGSSLIDLEWIADSPLAEGRLGHFCLLIDCDDLEGLISQLIQLGIEVPAPEVRYGATGFGHSVYILDPDGNQVELKPT